MLIVVPYVAGELQPETEASLIGWPGKVHKRRLDDTRYGYWRLIKELWASQSDIVLVEQDMAPSIEELRSLEMCQESPVCAYNYHREATARPVAALGLLRWRGRLAADVPWLLEREVRPEIPYDECDGTLYGRFQAMGLTVHVHGQTQHFRRRTMLVEVSSAHA